MPADAPSRRRRLVRYAVIGTAVCYGAVQFLAAEPRPWGLAVGWAAATALVFGPGAWLARDRLPPERRETLTYVAFGVGVLGASLWLGVSIAFAPRLVPFGPGFLCGVSVGVGLVEIADHTVVPARLRSVSNP